MVQSTIKRLEKYNTLWLKPVIVFYRKYVKCYVYFNIRLTNKYFVSEEFLVRKLKFSNFEAIELKTSTHSLLDNYITL